MRGAPVLQAVFQATFEELERVGYAGLRIEDVAVRAGVHKTTIYRRWPKRVDLVIAALLTLPPQYGSLPDEGSFRDDLIASGTSVMHFFLTVGGRAVLRVALFDGPSLPELASVHASWTAHNEQHGIEAIIHRAIARGELPRSFDGRALIDGLTCTISFRCLYRGPPDRAYVVRLVDALLGGLMPTAPRLVATKKGTALPASARPTAPKQGRRAHKAHKK